MIQFRCNWCQRELNASDDRGGQAVICPRCKARVTVPAAEIDSKPKEPTPVPVERVTTIQFRCNWCQRELNAPGERGGQAVICPRCKARVTVPSGTANDQPEESAPEDNEVARSPGQEHPSPLPGPVRRRMPWWPEPFTIRLFVGVTAVLLLLGLGVVLENRLLVDAAWLIGGLTHLVGLLWFLFVAFSDRLLRGFLCLVVPFYALFYLISNYEEARRPFFTFLAGTFLNAAAALVYNYVVRDLF